MYVLAHSFERGSCKLTGPQAMSVSLFDTADDVIAATRHSWDVLRSRFPDFRIIKTSKAFDAQYAQHDNENERSYFMELLCNSRLQIEALEIQPVQFGDYSDTPDFD